MKTLKLTLCVLLLSGLVSGCLITTQPLPGVNNSLVSQELIKGWRLGEGDFVKDVSDVHHFLNILTLPDTNDLIIVSSKDAVIYDKQAFIKCQEDKAICYDAQLPAISVVDNWKVMSLTDRFSTDDDKAFIVIAYFIDAQGLLNVYNIKDDSVAKAVADGKLTKVANASDINSNPEHVITWLKSLHAEDFQRYAVYQHVE